jgi:hypothetical protein
MVNVLTLIGLLVLAPVCWSRPNILIVADEIPAMEVLSRSFERGASARAQIVTQPKLPAELDQYSAVVVYLHRELSPKVEDALIRYTTNGGKLIALHHSISSGKRSNAHWFSFLGVDLPARPFEQGGYRWIESVTLEIVNLSPKHFITTHKVKYPEKFLCPDQPATGNPQLKPGFSLADSEVYLNHELSPPHQVLLGFKYHDIKSGRDFMQSTAGWLRPQGKGWVFYFMPGHSERDFQNPAYAQILLNALEFKPRKSTYAPTR